MITKEKLFEDFPECKPEFGFQISDGWIPLVYQLCRDLKELKFDGKVEQIKEKFGGLRFYVSTATDECHNLIQKAEEDSYKICEHCGQPGKLGKGGWLLTLCDKCREDKGWQ